MNYKSEITWLSHTYTNALKKMTDKEIRGYLVYLTDSVIEVDSVPDVSAG
jgi:ribonucleotide reductase beta subunit family protein with ferritin-like domain